MPTEVESREGAGTAFRVGDWRVDPSLNRISNAQTSVQLELKVMNVLVCLAERAGEVVTRQEIIDRVWATEYIADNTLTHAVAEIRTALGDDAREPRYIETIPRRGYRLIEKVEPVDAKSEGREGLPHDRPSKLRPAAWVAAFALLGLVLGYVLIAWQQPSSATSETEFDPHRIAVVPFSDRTGDPSLRALVDLTADRLTQGLAELDELQVAPVTVVRASSAGVDSAHLAHEVASATSAGLVLTGAWDAMGDRLELQATLEDATTGSVVHAFKPITASRDAPLEAITMLRERTLMAVQDRLHPALGLGAGDRWPDYRAYLAYRAWIENMGRVGGPSALEIDPEFVRARLGIALGLAWNDKLPQAKALLKPLESRTLNSAQTHFLRGVEHHLAYRWGHALSEFDWLREHGDDNFFVRFAQLFYGVRCNQLQQAVEVFESLGSPPFGIPLEGWARSIAVDAYHLLGRYDDELELARRWKGDSHGWLHVPSYVEARALIGLGRLDELQSLVADAQTRKDAGNFVFQIAYELDGHGYRSESIEVAEWSHQWYLETELFERGSVACERCIADTLRWVGRCREALEVYLEVEHQEPDNPRWWAGIGICAANVGDRDLAEAMIARFEALRKKIEAGEYALPTQYMWNAPGVAPWGQAGIEAALGHRRDALRLLREAIAQGWHDYMWIHSWDSFREMRDDPEFQEIVRPKG